MNEKIYVELLYKKYNKLVLTREELSKELNLSVSTLERLINKGDLSVRYKREGTGKKARYIFPIYEVANYLNSYKKIVA